MQRLHHRLELVHLPRRRIARVGREKADRVVAPVVAQPLLDEPTVVDEGVHRHQLDGGDAKALQVVDHRRCREPGVRAAQRWRHVRMLFREAAHVELVDHHVAPRHVGAAILSPSERRIDDLAFRHRVRAVAPIEGQVGALVADGVPEQRVAPAERADEVARVRVEEQLVRIEAQAFLGTIGSVHAIAVQHAGPRLRQIAVPDLVGALGERNPLQFAPPGGVEDAQVDALGVLGKQSEVHALAVPVGAARVGASRPDCGDRFHWGSNGRARTRAAPDRIQSDGGVCPEGVVSLSLRRDQRSRRSAARFWPPRPNASARPSAIAAMMMRNVCRMMSPSPN